MAYNKKYAELGESVIDYVNEREDAIEGAFESIGNVRRFQHTMKVTERSGNIDINLPFTVSGGMDVANGKVFIGTSLSQEYTSTGSLANTFTDAFINASIRYGTTVTLHWNLGRDLSSGRHAYLYVLVMYFK